MTERKTTQPKTALSISRRLAAGNIPAPWVPPELPAVPKRDLTKLKPWVPPELPASTSAAVPAVAKRDLTKLKPWVPAELPAAERAPRNLPATAPDDEDRSLVEPQPKRGKKQRPDELTQNVQAGPTIINIVNQVAAPAPVVYPLYWGGWWPPWWRRWWW